MLPELSWENLLLSKKQVSIDSSSKGTSTVHFCESKNQNSLSQNPGRGFSLISSVSEAPTEQACSAQPVDIEELELTLIIIHEAYVWIVSFSFIMFTHILMGGGLS